MKMSLENLVFKNGNWYDVETSKRVIPSKSFLNELESRLEKTSPKEVVVDTPEVVKPVKRVYTKRKQ